MSYCKLRSSPHRWAITENLSAQVSLHAMPELTEEIIHPGALETKSQLTEDLGEMKSQLSKQSTRVHELRIKKVEQPGMESPLDIGDNSDQNENGS